MKKKSETKIKKITHSEMAQTVNKRLDDFFLQQKNGSKTFYDLLRPIPTNTEGPRN